MSNHVREVLQSVTKYLLNEPNMGWRLESFCIEGNALHQPYMTAEAVVFARDLHLCVRKWDADQIRIALRISHGLNKSTAPNGRRAPTEHQREPNVVTPVTLMSIDDARQCANDELWGKVIASLINKARRDLLALVDDLNALTPDAK